MRLSMRTLLFVTMLLSALPTCAAELVLTRIGVPDCDQWLLGRKRGTAVLDEKWLLGFLSGYSSALETTLVNDTEPQKLMSWTDRYCQNKPHDSLQDAARRLAVDLKGKNTLSTPRKSQ